MDIDEIWEQHSESVQTIICGSVEDNVIMTRKDFNAACAAVLAASGLVRIEDELRKARDIGAKKSPRLVVCAVIFRDGKVLLERRAPKGTDGLDHKWDLPGGKVEINETPEEAIIREIAEELFVSIRSTRMIPYLLTSKWTYADGEERHWILNAYVCEIIGGEPVCGTDLQWFDIRNLPLDILEADRNLVTVAWQSGSRRAAPRSQRRSRAQRLVLTIL